MERITSPATPLPPAAKGILRHAEDGMGNTSSSSNVHHHIAFGAGVGGGGDGDQHNRASAAASARNTPRGSAKVSIAESDDSSDDDTKEFLQKRRALPAAGGSIGSGGGLGSPVRSSPSKPPPPNGHMHNVSTTTSVSPVGSPPTGPSPGKPFTQIAANNNSIAFNPSLLGSASLLTLPNMSMAAGGSAGAFNTAALLAMMSAAGGGGGPGLANESFRSARTQVLRNQSLVSEMIDRDVTLAVPGVGAGDATELPETAGGAHYSYRAGGAGTVSSKNSSPATSISGRRAANRQSVAASSYMSQGATPRVPRSARQAFGRTLSSNTNTLGRHNTPHESSEDESARRSDLRSERSGNRIFAAVTRPSEKGSSAGGWWDAVADSDDDSNNDDDFDALAYYDRFQGKDLTILKRIRYILDNNPHHKDATVSFVINGILFLTILVSIIVFLIQSFPTYYNDQNLALQILESICVAIFILEALLRVISAPNLRSLLNFFFIVDVISILGFFLDLILKAVITGGGGAGLSIVRVIRLVRVFRVLKVSRHSTSMQVVLMVLKSSMSGLIVLMVPILLIVVTAGFLLFYVETSSTSYRWDVASRTWLQNGKPAIVQSIPDVLWFALTTVTTVGFGDVTMTTIAARTLGALLQLVGVLMVNFPNIILGGNVQVAYKEYTRHRAIRKLGKKFRRVYMCVCFIAALREKVEARKYIVSSADDDWAAFRPDEVRADDDGGSPTLQVGDGVDLTPSAQPQQGGGQLGQQVSGSAFPTVPEGTGLMANARVDGAAPGGPRITTAVGGMRGNRGKKPTVNYIMTAHEASNYAKADVPPIEGANVRSWSYKGITAVSVLQRLLEAFSGVGTTEELHQSYIGSGHSGAMLKDVDIVCLYLLAAGYLQLFAFKKFGVNMLCALTPDAITELMVNAEDGQVDCVRSAEMARVLWRRTTGITASFALSLLAATYPVWSSTEKLADNEASTPFTDLKVLYDDEGNLKPMPTTSFFSQTMAMGLERSGSFRRSTSANTRDARKRAAEAAEGRMREEAKDTLKDVLAQRDEYIATLRAKVEMAMARRSRSMSMSNASGTMPLMASGRGGAGGDGATSRSSPSPTASAAFAPTPINGHGDHFAPRSADPTTAAAKSVVAARSQADGMSPPAVSHA